MTCTARAQSNSTYVVKIQDAFKTLQDAPKMPKTPSKRAQDAPRHLQDAMLMSFGSQSGGKTTPRRSKMRPRHPRRLQNAPKTPQDTSKTRC